MDEFVSMVMEVQMHFIALVHLVTLFSLMVFGAEMNRVFLLLVLSFGTADAFAANTYERVADVIQLSVEFGSLQGNPDGTMSENIYRYHLTL